MSEVYAVVAAVIAATLICVAVFFYSIGWNDGEAKANERWQKECISRGVATYELMEPNGGTQFRWTVGEWTEKGTVAE